MARSLPVDYAPSTPPQRFEDWPRWIDDELNRIAVAFRANNVVMAIHGSGTIPIEITLQTVTLGIGDTPSIDYPGGAWNTLTGEWTCPLSGLYSINASAFLDAFGAGNKSYYAKLDVYKNNILIETQIDGGADDVPLGVSMATPHIFLVGDVLRADLSAQHDQFTGDTTYQYDLNYLRNGGI